MVADQISCIFGLLHSDLHEERAAAALEYMSSMVATVEPYRSVDGQRGYLENSLSEQNFTKGKFHVRFKRRNGRVRVTVMSFFLFVSLFGMTNLQNWDTDIISLNMCSV